MIIEDQIIYELLFPIESKFVSEMNQIGKLLTNTNSNYPKIDVYYDNENYVIELLCGGIKKEDIQVSIKERLLTISYEKKENLANRKYLLKQISNASFEKRITLPTGIENPEKAEFENGKIVLKFKIREEAKSKNIPIE